MVDVVLHFPVNLHNIGKNPPYIVSDRIAPVLQISKGKKVLNIGCCGSDIMQNVVPVHQLIHDVSSYCVGIDIFEQGIKKLHDMNYNCFYANAEDFNLPVKGFDIAILGDIIEHVENPGSVLRQAHNHLNDNGKIIITTPNVLIFSKSLRYTFDIFIKEYE